jgi:carbonic anhydrase/acetyltransferase-like protein (isoleucine patch superfamily)
MRHFRFAALAATWCPSQALLLLACAHWLGGPQAHALVGRGFTDEFRVNAQTSLVQSNPAVAAAADGSFVVVWASTRNELRARRVGPTGAPDRDELPLGFSYPASMAGDAAGSFVVVWSGFYGVYGRLFDRSGAARAALDVAISYSRFDQHDVAMAAGGEFVAVWAQYGVDINVRRYDRDGEPLGEAVRDVGRGVDPAAGMSDDGSFVVVWSARSGREILGQRFNRRGERSGALVVSTGTGRKQRPDVAMARDGSFVVVWQSQGDGEGWGIFGQRFSPAGRRRGGEFQVNTTVANDQLDPAVTMEALGGFFVAWTSVGQDGSAEGIFGQLFDASGQRVEGERQVNVQAAGAQIDPAVAMAPGGTLLAVWQGPSGADTADIHGRRLLPTPSNRDGDGDGVLDGLDNCPTVPNPDQADAQNDGFGDACISPDVVLPADLRLGANPQIGTGTTLGSGVTLGADTTIGEQVRLGERVRAGDRFIVHDIASLGPGSRAGNDVSIGEATQIEGGVRLHDAVTVGDHVAIRRNAVVESRVRIESLALISTGARIGVGATIEMGAVVGRRAVVGPGAVVPAGTTVPAGGTFP